MKNVPYNYVDYLNDKFALIWIENNIFKKLRLILCHVVFSQH